MRLAEPVEAGEFHDGFNGAFEDDGEDDDVEGFGFAEAGGDLDVIGGDAGEEDLFLLDGALADEAFAEAEAVVDVLPFFVGVAGQQLERRLVGFAGGVHDVEDALLGRDHGGQFGQNEPTHREQILLALQHAAELGEVGFEPVLLGVFLRGVAQIADHLVDGVFKGGHFALGFE